MTIEREELCGALGDGVPHYTEAELKRQRRLEAVVLGAVFAVVAAVAVVTTARQATRERAAYNEGRLGVDRATAWAMAERGVGKTAAEVIAERGRRGGDAGDGAGDGAGGKAGADDAGKADAGKEAR